jgi:hypothetical protein
MNDRMSIAPSFEEGMYILREGDYVWRVNRNGMIDCSAKDLTCVFEQLAIIRQWKTPSHRIFQDYPLEDSSN